MFLFCNLYKSFATERFAQRTQSLRDNRTLAGADRVQEEETLFQIATKLEAEDHKKELMMVVAVCGHMPYVNKIVWHARNKAWHVFVKWWPENLHLAYRSCSRIMSGSGTCRRTTTWPNCPAFLSVPTGLILCMTKVSGTSSPRCHRAFACCAWCHHERPGPHQVHAQRLHSNSVA